MSKHGFFKSNLATRKKDAEAIDKPSGVGVGNDGASGVGVREDGVGEGNRGPSGGDDVKKSGAASAAHGGGEMAHGGGSAEQGTDGARGGGEHTAGDGDKGSMGGAQGNAVEVYNDISVCNCLGVRRRVLNDARTAKTRGEDWDCVGMHAGMTWKWVNKYAMKNGIVPKFAAFPLRIIAEGDGVVSVRLVGMTPRPDVCIVERLADGQREYARVRNMIDWPIHLRECFDCVRAQNLEWSAQCNSVKY